MLGNGIRVQAVSECPPASRRRCIYCLRKALLPSPIHQLAAPGQGSLGDQQPSVQQPNGSPLSLISSQQKLQPQPTPSPPRLAPNESLPTLSYTSKQGTASRCLAHATPSAVNLPRCRSPAWVSGYDRHLERRGSAATNTTQASKGVVWHGKWQVV